MSKKYAYFTLLWLFLILLPSCGSATPKVVAIPTLAVLPSATPTATFTPMPTITPSDTPTATWTPNLVETQLEWVQATNAAAQTTLAALLTANAVTDTPSMTVTPSPTLTDTLIPSMTPVPVVALQPQVIYARSPANLRTCASRTCDQVAQLQSGDAVTANGTIAGEMIDGAHANWYRVDYQGRLLFVYGQLMSITPPTTVPVFVATLPPVSPPQVSAPSGCPDVHANCSALTCAQAYACLAAGDSKLDRDKDGIPCESICSP